MKKAEKIAKKFEAAKYYESSLDEHDAEWLNDFMLENRVSPDELVILSQTEASWECTTLAEVKTELDKHKIKNTVWFSKEEGEDRIAWIV